MRHPLHTPIGRFGIETFHDDVDGCVATMPVAGLLNPITGAASLGPLAVLVDHVAGLVNHRRRTAEIWAVSSELALEASPDAAAVIAAHPDAPVLGTSRPVGSRTTTALGECALTVADVVIGTGTVRSFFVAAPAAGSDNFPEEPEDVAPPVVGLAALMNAGRAVHADGAVTLPQLPDPVLNNTMGVVHGGIASTGLEVVASAAINAGRDDPLVTASLRVNFVRPFLSSDQSRYVGTPLRVGRSSGIADAQAIGADGRVAITARLTAYRC
jgi:uncharacterized protein (TIGR00369 family)